MQFITTSIENQNPVQTELEAAYTNLRQALQEAKGIVLQADQSKGHLDPLNWSARIERSLNDTTALDETRSLHKRARIVQTALGLAFHSEEHRLEKAWTRMQKALHAAMSLSLPEDEKILRTHNCVVAADLYDEARAYLDKEMRSALGGLYFNPKSVVPKTERDLTPVFQEALKELEQAQRDYGEYKQIHEFITLNKNSLRLIGSAPFAQYDPTFLVQNGEAWAISSATCLELRERITQLDKYCAEAEAAYKSYFENGKGIVNEKQHANRLVEALYRTEAGKPASYEAEQLVYQDKRRCAYFSAALAMNTAAFRLHKFIEGTLPLFFEAVNDTVRYEPESICCVVPILDCLIADLKLRQSYALWQRLSTEAGNDVTARRGSEAYNARLKRLQEFMPKK